MRQGLCNGTVSVCLSVSLSRPSIAACCCGRRVCCCGPGGQVISIGPHSSTAFSSKCGQCHVVRRRGKLSTHAELYYGIVKHADIAVRSLTCRMGSHSVTCHPTKVTFPPLPQPKLVLDLATPERCKAELTVPAQRRSPIPVVTRPDVR